MRILIVVMFLINLILLTDKYNSAQATRGFYKVNIQGTTCITNGDTALSCNFN